MHTHVVKNHLLNLKIVMELKDHKCYSMFDLNSRPD